MICVIAESDRLTDARGMNALACLRAAVTRATLGLETMVQLREPAGRYLERLIDKGMLDRAIPLWERGGSAPRILMVPRRRRGPPSLTEMLSADHARLDDLLESLEEHAKKHDFGVVSIARRFSWSMKRHMRLEDELLFPLYEQSSGVALEGHVRPLHIEHACIEHYLSLLDTQVDALARGQHTMDDIAHLHCGLSSVLSDHDAREEKTLLPTIDHTLGFVQRPDVLRIVATFDPDVVHSSLRMRSRASAEVR